MPQDHVISLWDVLKFLRPVSENSVSVGFFLLILLLLLAGLCLGLISRLLLFPQAQARVKRDYKNSEVSSSDVEAALQRLDVAGGLALHLPAQILVVGLLGTFVGIGLAIQEVGGILDGGSPPAAEATEATEATPNMAAPTLDGNAELHGKIDQVSTVLAKLGIKFQTSCWGILGSFGAGGLAFVLVSAPRRRAAYEVAAVCHAARDQRERQAREQQALAVATDRNSLAECQRALGQLAVALAPANTKQSVLGSLSEQLQRLSDISADLREVGWALNGNPAQTVDGMLARLTRIEEQLKDVPLAAKKMADAGGAVATALSEFSRTAGKALTNIQTAATTLGASATAMEGAAKGIGGTVGKALTGFSTTTAKTLSDAADKISGSSEAVKGAITEMKTELSRSLTELNQGAAGMTSASDRVENALGDIDETAKLMSEAVSGFKTDLAKLVNASSRVSEALNNFNQIQRSFRDGGDSDAVLGGIRAIRDSTASLVQLLADVGPGAVSVPRQVVAALASIDAAAGGSKAHLAQLSGALLPPTGQTAIYPKLAQDFSVALAGLRGASDAVAARAATFDLLAQQVGGMAGPAGVPSLADNMGMLLAATAEIRSGLGDAHGRSDDAIGLRDQLGLIAESLKALTKQFDDLGSHEGRSLARQIGEMQEDTAHIRRALEHASDRNDANDGLRDHVSAIAHTMGQLGPTLAALRETGTSDRLSGAADRLDECADTLRALTGKYSPGEPETEGGTELALPAARDLEEA